MTNNNFNGKSYFKEVQHYSKFYVGVILSLLFIGLVVMIWYTYNTYQNERSLLEFLKNYGFLLFSDIVLLGINIWAFIYFSKINLTTKVTGRSVYFKKHAFKKKYRKIKSGKIEDAELATIGNLPKGTRKVKIKGNKGVLLKLSGRRNIFIGSQHAESLLKSIQKMLSNLDK